MDEIVDVMKKSNTADERIAQKKIILGYPERLALRRENTVKSIECFNLWSKGKLEYKNIPEGGFIDHDQFIIELDDHDDKLIGMFISEITKKGYNIEQNGEILVITAGEINNEESEYPHIRVFVKLCLCCDFCGCWYPCVKNEFAQGNLFMTPQRYRKYRMCGKSMATSIVLILCFVFILVISTLVFAFSKYA